MMKDRWLSFASPLLLIALWEALVAFRVLDARFFSPPSAVMGALWRMLGSGELGVHISATVARVVIGFLAGGIPAVALGMLMGIWRPARYALEPLAAALYPIPKIAILPLIILLFGIGEEAKIITIAISVFFLVLLNTVAGVLAIDPRYFEVGRTLGAKRQDLYWTVALPGALPAIMTGARLGLGFALTVIVGTEFLGARDGIGALIWLSHQAFRIDEMFVGLVVVAVLGWASNLILEEVERRVIPWRAPPRSAEPEAAWQRSVRVFWRATRPFSFTASITPVLLGCVIAAYDGALNVVLFALTLAGAVSIHAGTNMVNDYYDHVKGVDTPDSLGPSGVIQQGLLTAQQVLAGGLALFALGSAIGVYLTIVSGPFILLLGILSVAAGFFYTAGPAALAYVGLGELTAFVFMGPVMVGGAYFVQARQADWRIFALSLPIGFLVAAILHANNMRDLEADRALGKRTLATLIGRTWGIREYRALLIASYVSLVLVVSLGFAPFWLLAALLTAPLAYQNIQSVGIGDDRQVQNRLIRRTANLHARFGQLMVLGFLVAMALQRLSGR